MWLECGKSFPIPAFLTNAWNSPSTRVNQRFKIHYRNCAEYFLSGGAQNTLQDVKLPECSGGFVYADQSHSLTRNRMIIWRTSHDVLELVETSLDWDLRANRVKYRFQDTPVLSGVSIHETYHHVVILVATVSSVHKLVFTHPKCLHKQDLENCLKAQDGLPSILAEANTSTPVDNFYVLPSSGVGK